MATEGRIAAVDDVPDETTYLCTVREIESGEEREVILVRDGGEIRGMAELLSTLHPHQHRQGIGCGDAERRVDL